MEKEGREWKNHKWVDRKRGKDGKWIYDYGEGFGKIGKTSEIKPGKDYDFDLNTISPLEKVGNFLSSIAGTVLRGDINDKLIAGQKFLGSIGEGLKRLSIEASRFGDKVDEDNGLPLKKTETSKEEDLSTVNPGWENPDEYSQHNCPGCSVAYDLRRRGYDVIAKEFSNGLSEEEVASFYDGAVIKDVTADKSPFDYSNLPEWETRNYALADSVIDALDSEPEGSRGMAYMYWYGGGHIVSYEVENGRAILYDAQSGEKVKPTNYVVDAAAFRYFRTDNLEPNYEQVKKVVE